MSLGIKGNINSLHYYTVFFFSSVYLVLSFGIIQSGFFIWDDKEFLFHNVITDGNFGLLLNSAHYGMFHPITTLWIKLNFLLHGNNPHILHLENILIHILNSWLVFNILKKFSFTAIIGFIIFLFHPLNTEAVYWITSIKDLIFGFFTLLCINYYVEYRNDNNKKYFGLSMVFAFLALFSKPQAIVLPFILLSIDYLYEKMIYRKSILQKLPLFILSTVVLLINLYIRYNYKDITSLPDYSLPERLIIVSDSFSHSLYSLFFPFNQSIFYPYPFRPGEDYIQLLGLVLIPLLYFGFIFIAHMRKIRMLEFILLAFLFLALPVVQLIPIGESLTNDRYSYLQVFVFAVGIEFVLPGFKQKINLKGILVSIFILLSVGYLLIGFHQRTSLWKHQKDLFISAFERFPQSEIISNTLGVIFIKENKIDSAMLFLNKSIQLEPNFAQAYYNKGIALEKIRKTEAAIGQYQKSISINALYSAAQFRLAQIYYNSNRLDSAEYIVNQVLHLNTTNAAFLDLNGKILYQKGNVRSSIKYYESALRLDKNNPVYLYNLAVSVGYQGDYSHARSLLIKCIKINPRFHEAYYLLGIVKINLGENGCLDLKSAQALGNKLATAALEKFCDGN